ncbi:replicase [Beihai hepe-like virus 8]|uniref:replicase n=1 Tax=Beihai hepe-like virus 8 TaxID=1922385 RepID=UPI00090C1D71|nr:replicase [Beihai hepe-like virus 8]APG77600.1 replicase [Beihai hepe-like virus 8]
MSVLDVKNYPSAARESVAEAVSHYWEDFYKNSTKNVIKIPWRVTPTVASLAHKVFAPVVFEFGSELSMSSHPIAAIALSLGNTVLKNVCPNPSLDIGPNFFKLDKVASVHKVDGRDYGRAMKATEKFGVGPLQHVTSMNSQLDGIDQAKKVFGSAIMNNVYDIPFDDLPQIMHEKKISVIHAVMILPPMLIYKQEMYDDECGYGLRFVDDSRKMISMYFKDQSFVYTHDYDNWFKWCTQPVVEGMECNVVVERARTLGCLTYLQITKTRYGVTLTNPMPTPLNDMKQVLDFGGIADVMVRKIHSYNYLSGNDIRKIIRRAKKVYVPKHMYDDTVIFMINRDDKLMDRNVAGTYLQGKMQTITISDHVINQGFRMNAEDFAVVAKTAFIESCVHRYRATKEIGAILNLLKSETPSFWRKVKNTITNWLELDSISFFRLTLDDVHDLSRAEMSILFSLMCTTIELTFFEETAKSHMIKRWNWHTQKTHHYEPPSDGFCMVNCINKMVVSPVKYPPLQTNAQYAALLRKDGYEDVTQHATIHVGQGVNHATIGLSARVICSHGRFRTPVVEAPKPILLSHDYSRKGSMSETTYAELTAINTNGLYFDHVEPLRYASDGAKYCYINPQLVKGTDSVELIEDIEYVNFDYNPFCDLCEPKRITMFYDAAVLTWRAPKLFQNLLDRMLDGSVLVISNFDSFLKVPTKEVLDFLRYLSSSGCKIYENNRDATVAVIKDKSIVSKNALLFGPSKFSFKFSHKVYTASVETQTNQSNAYSAVGNARIESSRRNYDGWLCKWSTVHDVCVGPDVPVDYIIPIIPTAPEVEDIFGETFFLKELERNIITRVGGRLIFRDSSGDEFLIDGSHAISENGVKYPHTQLLVDIDGTIVEQSAYLVDGTIVGEGKHETISQYPESAEYSDYNNSIDCFKQVGYMFGAKEEAAKFINRSTSVEDEVSRVLEAATFIKPLMCYVKKVAAGILYYKSNSKQNDKEVENVIKNLSFTPAQNQGYFNGLIYGVYNNRVYGEAYDKIPLRFIKKKLDIPDRYRDMFVRCLHTNDEKYKDVHNRAIDNIRDMKLKSEINVQVALGCAGSGKTTSAINFFDKKNTTVVVPYSELAREYRNKGFQAKTIASFLSGQFPDPGDNILLDEAFAMHPGAILVIANISNNIYMIGDNKQMGYNDSSDNIKCRSLAELFNFDDCYRMNVSLAVPIDIVRWLHSEYENGWTTMNTLLNSVKFVHSDPEGDNKLAFATADATRYNCKTVAAVQGMRKAEIHLIFSSKAHALTRVLGQKLVALTRHTKRLFIHILNAAVHTVMDFPQSEVPIGARLDFRTLHGHYDYAKAHFKTKPLNISDQLNDDIIAIDNQSKDFGVSKDDFMAARPSARKISKLKSASGKFGKQSHDNGEVTISLPAMYTINKAVYDVEPIDVHCPAPFNLNKHADDSHRLKDDIYKMADTVTSYVEIEEIMQEISPSSSELYESRRDIRHEQFKDIESGKKLKIKEKNRPLFTESMRRTFVSASRLRGRPTNQQNFSQELQTAIGRYAKKNVNMTKAEAMAGADVLWEGYNKLVDVSKITPITMEELSLACACQATKIHDKNENQDEGLFGLSYASTEKIKFHLKHQVKADLKVDSWLRGEIEDGVFRVKAGQGISARPKTVNHLCGCYVRAMENKLASCFRKGVTIGYGKNPCELSKHVASSGIAQETASVDISEQDTTKAPHVYEFSRRLHQRCGVPKFVSDILILGNWFWSLVGKELILDVQYKFQSGRPDTLFDNTAHNMAVLGSHFNFKGLKMLLATGDDGCIKADKIERTGCDLFKIKVDRNVVGDFVGFIIGDRKVYLDTPRLVTKLCNREFADAERVHEYEVAVQDWLSVNDTYDEFVQNNTLVALKYGISYSAASRLMSFLVCFSKGKVISEDFRTANVVRSTITQKILT